MTSMGPKAKDEDQTPYHGHRKDLQNLAPPYLSSFLTSSPPTHPLKFQPHRIAFTLHFHATVLCSLCLESLTLRFPLLPSHSHQSFKSDLSLLMNQLRGYCCHEDSVFLSLPFTPFVPTQYHPSTYTFIMHISKLQC